MKFKKKPVVIEAEQYKEYGKLVTGMCNSVSCSTSGNYHPHVHTIHDNQIVLIEPGDYIIPEPDGVHFYPCKPDIFKATYEKCNPPSPSKSSDEKPDFEKMANDEGYSIANVENGGGFLTYIAGMRKIWNDYAIPADKEIHANEVEILRQGDEIESLQKELSELRVDRDLFKENYEGMSGFLKDMVKINVDNLMFCDQWNDDDRARRGIKKGESFMTYMVMRYHQSMEEKRNIAKERDSLKSELTEAKRLLKKSLSISSFAFIDEIESFINKVKE